MPITYDSIATVSRNSQGQGMTLSSIPGTYTDLRLIIRNIVGAAGSQFGLRFNSDTATNYSAHMFANTATTIAGNTENNIGEARVGALFDSMEADIPMGIIVDIYGYSQSINKTLTALTFPTNNGNKSNLIFCDTWRSTSAITSIEFYAYNSVIGMQAASTMSLYGITKA